MRWEGRRHSQQCNMGKIEYDASVHSGACVSMVADKSRLVSSWGRCRCEAQWARMADKSSRETFLRLVHQQRAVLAQCLEMGTGTTADQSFSRLSRTTFQRRPSPSAGFFSAVVRPVQLHARLPG